MLISITWHDRDGSRTEHYFATPDGAEAWLASVLHEAVTEEEVLADYEHADGLGKLVKYCDEGYDEVGSLEVYLDGQGITAFDLYSLGHLGDAPPTPSP